MGSATQVPCAPDWQGTRGMEAPPRVCAGGASYTWRSLPSLGSGPDALQDPKPPAHMPLKKPVTAEETPP